MNVIYYSDWNKYWSAYFQCFCIWICFLMNKILSLSNWSVNYLQSDLATFILQLKNHVFYIHNVYSKLFDMLNTVFCDFLFYTLKQLLDKSDKHFILNDFNLHYFMWEDIKYLIRYCMTDDLMRFVKEVKMQLLILLNMITWENCESITTMNLILIFSWLIQWVIYCIMNSELENNSNHDLIILLFILNIILQILKQKCSWKRMNKKRIIADIQHLYMFKFLDVFSNIEVYTDYLMNFIQQLMNLIMLLIKFFRKYLYNWWFSEVENVIYQAWTVY